MSKDKFIIKDVAEVSIVDKNSGEVKYSTEVKGSNLYDFIEEWNKIGCQSFSREALLDETCIKMIKETKANTDRVDIGIKLLKLLNKDLDLGEKITHLHIYKDDELYVEVTDYSPFANKNFMTKSLRKALKNGKTLTYQQHRELERFKIEKVLYI